MRALTLSQPWATLVALGHKRVETRSWSTQHRGPIAIHAAKSWPMRYREICLNPPFHDLLPWFQIAPGQVSLDLPVGMVVATARLVDVVPVEEAVFGITEQEVALGDYTEGRFAWLLADVEALDEPVRAKGALGLWNWTGSAA